MTKKLLESLDEDAFYVLSACLDEEKSCLEIFEYIKLKMQDKLIGPGTLYAIIGELEKNDLLIDAMDYQRKQRMYQTTDKGKQWLDAQNGNFC